MGIETELKLRIAPEQMARLKRHPLLRDLSSSKPQSRRLYNIYFDTPGRYLHQHEMALRLRRIGRKWLQTLKGGGAVQAGLHLRSEWETPVAGEALELDTLEEAGATHLPGKVRQALRAEFVTDFTRSIHQLKFAGAEVELGMDSGVITAGRRKHAISELELELKAGRPAQLFELALALQEIVAVEVEGTSKAEYGYRLRDRTRPAVAKLEMPELGKHSTPAEALQGMIWSCLQQVQANAPGAIARWGDEYLHQIRVALRRLRVLLGMAVRVQADGELALLRQAVADLALELGHLREWDVLVGQTLPPALEQLADQAGMEEVLRHSERQRRQAHMAARKRLQSQDFQRLLLRFGAWMLGPYWQLPVWQEEACTLPAFARQVLRRQLRRVQKRYTALAKAPTPEQLHALRIACKKLRYSAELFAALYSKQAVKRHVSALSAVQDALGYLNDIAVARRLFAEIGTGRRRDACMLLHGWLEHDYAQHLKALRRVWKRFAAQTAFWVE